MKFQALITKIINIVPLKFKKNICNNDFFNKHYKNEGIIEFHSILPKKKILNRLFFENNFKFSYKQIIPVLEKIYLNLNNDAKLEIFKNIDGSDLMILKDVFSKIRKKTNLINKKFLLFENELVRHAADLGNKDAISLLCFETIFNYENKNDKTISHNDYQHAIKLFDVLYKSKHSLTIKFLGDLCFYKKNYDSSKCYWLEFINIEDNTELSVQVYSNLGLLFFKYNKPKVNLKKALLFFKKSILYNQTNSYTIQSHYYLGQIYLFTDPLISRYHWRICASHGLKESFFSLGFLELNVFQNFLIALEWFNLSIEAGGNIDSFIGKFDCLIKLKDYKSAYDIYVYLRSIHDKTMKKKYLSLNKFEFDKRKSIDIHLKSLELFFQYRTNEIQFLEKKFSSQNFV